MFNGLHDLDWSSIRHAYGSADEAPALLRALFGSTASMEPNKALSSFYSVVRHQGGVHPCTTASPPFLSAPAGDAATPDPPLIIELLVSVGSEAVERREDEYADPVDFVGAAAMVRECAGPQPRGWGCSLTTRTGPRRCRATRSRPRPVSSERLQVVKAMATPALRLPTLSDDAMAWFAEPAREALDAHVAAQRAAHGPDVWTAPRPQLRRAHQEAVRALARLGDIRAVPSVLAGPAAAPSQMALPGVAAGSRASTPTRSCSDSAVPPSGGSGSDRSGLADDAE